MLLLLSIGLLLTVIMQPAAAQATTGGTPFLAGLQSFLSGVPKPAPEPEPEAVAAAPPAAAAATVQGFIRIVNGSFVDPNCNEFLFSGWNGWVNTVVDAQNAVASLPPMPPGTPEQLVLATALSAPADPIAQRFKDANAAGFTAMRLFGFGGDGPGYSALETSPGVYNETVFKGIDYILALAGLHQIRVIYCLTTYWQNADAIGNYVLWAGLGTSFDAFWDSTKARQLYYNHVATVVNRVNTFTGVAYKDDPTILGWDLFNEMRCPESQMPPGCPESVKGWIDDAAAYLKSIDANHLVTVGEEGFSMAGSPYERYNPTGVPSNVQPGWASDVGQDQFTQHLGPDIDFVAVHLWPDNWNTLGLDFPSTWLAGAVQIATALGKPVILEEFGKAATGDAANITAVRDPYFREVYGIIEDSMKTAGPLKGALFWQWNFPSEGRDVNGIYKGDTAFGLSTNFANAVNSLGNPVVAGCTPAAASAATPAVTEQSQTAAAG